MGLSIGCYILSWNDILYFNNKYSAQRNNTSNFGVSWREVKLKHRRSFNMFVREIDEMSTAKLGVLENLCHSGVSFWIKVLSRKPINQHDCYFVKIYVEYADKTVTCYLHKEELERLALQADSGEKLATYSKRVSN